MSRTAFATTGRRTTWSAFNTDPEKPAKFISVQPRYWAAFGFGGILQIEEAPECA